MFELNDDYYLFEESDPAVLGMLKKHSPGKGRTVLDVGCGRAALGGAVERMGFRVTGIEYNKVGTKTASGRVTEILEMDLRDHHNVDEAFAGRSFDFIIIADVLEHLSDPLATLRFYRQFLAEDGIIIVSVPNVAVWDNRLRLFFGAFNYADSGLMDRTHLRFFTFRTTRMLIEEGGYKIHYTDFSPGIVRAFLPMVKRLLFATGAENERGDPAAIMDSSAYKAYKAYLLPVERLICALAKGLFAFRIVIVAARTRR